MAGRAAHRPFARVLSVHRGQAHVLPGQLQARAGQLQGGHVGQHLDGFHTQACRQKGRDAIAQRVARGQQHHAQPVGAGLAHPFGHLAQGPAHVALQCVGGNVLREQRQRTLRANHHLGLAQVLQGLRTQAGGAVVEHTDDAARGGHRFLAQEEASVILLPSKSHTSTRRVKALS